MTGIFPDPPPFGFRITTHEPFDHYRNGYGLVVGFRH
jgi:hypothetical protein